MNMSNSAGKQGTGRIDKADRTNRQDELVGSTLRGGEYQIKRVIGHGGMGKVFLASHITLETALALKQCRADQPLPESVVRELEQLLHRTASTPDTQQGQDAGGQPATGSAAQDFPSSGGIHTDRFLREALLLARLNHPAIPALYDYFFENGYWYLVMEYIPGPTLSVHMRRQGALPPLEALHYAIQLCDVLAYLHRQTPPIIFRDLKPSNIILTPAQRLVLVDFGIARYFKDGQASDTNDLGSPGYAAPEQYEGESQTDARSDLYSLGIILHEMLSGQRTAHLNQQPEPLSYLNPNLSPVLSALVTVATRLEPDYRFQTARTLSTALARTYTLEEYHACEQAATNQPPYTGRPPHLDQPAAMRGEELQRTREILAEAHRQQQAREQLEQELTAVDESLHLRAYLSFSSMTPSLAHAQKRAQETRRRLPLTARAFRVAQICFVCALVLFFIMASLLVYTRNQRPDNGSTITPGQQTNASPTATASPTGIWQPLPSPPSTEADNSATYVELQGNGYIYMNGGYRGPEGSQHYDRSLYRYNIAAARWETLATDNFPGMVNNAAALDERGNLFFTAGYSSDSYAVTSLLYAYRPAQASLQKIVPPAQMPLGFGAAMIADQQGHLYITQGFMQAGNPTTSAGTGWYRYDIATRLWRQLAPLPQGLGYVVLAPDGAGSILLLGGSTDAGQNHPTTHIYRYNIALNAWTVAQTSAPLAFSGAASCLVSSGYLVVIGGYNATSHTSRSAVWLVDLRNLQWTQLTTIPNGGSLLGAAACDGHGHVFLLRGANSPSQPTANFWELTIRNMP